MANTGKYIGVATGAIVGSAIGYEVIRKHQVAGLIGGFIVFSIAGFFIGKAIDNKSTANTASSGGGNFNIENPQEASVFNSTTQAAYNPNITDQQAHDQLLKDMGITS